jgi:hypothetical protein
MSNNHTGIPSTGTNGHLGAFQPNTRFIHHQPLDKVHIRLLLNHLVLALNLPRHSLLNIILLFHLPVFTIAPVISVSGCWLCCTLPAANLADRNTRHIPKR